MLTPKFLIAASLAVVAAAEQAPFIKRNPSNTVAVADLPAGGDSAVKGIVVFTAKEGKEVGVHVDVTGLPRQGGPFVYHIHDYPVPEDGNCEAVGEHLNPYNASADCDSQKDDSFCQVGDLSGKHGWIDTTCFETKYKDPFLSLNPKSRAYVVGKSIVFHYKDLTKFACANIEIATAQRLKELQEEFHKVGNTDLDEIQLYAQETADEGVAAEEYENHKRELMEEEVLTPVNISNVTSANHTNVSQHGITSCDSANGYAVGYYAAGLALLAGVL